MWVNCDSKGAYVECVFIITSKALQYVASFTDSAVLYNLNEQIIAKNSQVFTVFVLYFDLCEKTSIARDGKTTFL